MTAHAMAGDEAKSMEAGMNDHVTKPIDPDQLFTALRKWIKPIAERVATPTPLHDPEEQQTSHATTQPEKAVPDEEFLPESLPEFDLVAGLNRLSGNKRLYRKLLIDFGTRYTETAREIREAIDAEDFDQVHSLVHNLKGLAGNLGATELQAAAMSMEKLVKGIDKKILSPKQLNLRFSELENALNQALESAQSLGVFTEETIGKLSAEELVDIPTELARDIAKRIREAAEMGDVTTLNAIAEEIRTRSGSCIPLSQQIVQLAEDIDLDGIEKLADALNAS